jgi:hypothetical protein
MSNNWRRKAGFITLMMACVLIVVWAKTRSTAKFYFCEPGAYSLNLYGSAESSLILGVYRGTDPSILPRSNCWAQSEVSQANAVSEILRESRTSGRAFSMSTMLSHNQLKEDFTHQMVLTVLLIPCWSVVLPLTLLSAYLLLSKPVKAKLPVNSQIISSL